MHVIHELAQRGVKAAYTVVNSRQIEAMFITPGGDVSRCVFANGADADRWLMKNAKKHFPMTFRDVIV